MILPKSSKGFTLVELMVVIAVIGILATIGVAVYSNAQKSARDARRKGDIDAIAMAYEANYNPVKNKYALLGTSDFQSGKFPAPPEAPLSYYDGFNSSQYFDTTTGKGGSWRICAKLEGQTTPCTQTSATCYCRSSTQGTTAEAVSGSGSTLTFGAGGSVMSVSPIPTDGLVLWLRADDINAADATQVAGGSVIKWVSSPYCCNKDAIKKGTYATPTLVSSAINSKPLVRFVGGWNGFAWTGQVLEVANLTGSSYLSLFFVGRIVNNYPLSWGNPPYVSGINKGGFYTVPSQLSEYLNGVYSGTSGGAQNWQNNSVNTIIKSSSFACYQGLNSTGCSTSGTNIGQGNITGNFVIGGMEWNSSAAVDYFGTADFAEVILYNRPLVGSSSLDTERNQVINYLKSKYAL